MPPNTHSRSRIHKRPSAPAPSLQMFAGTASRTLAQQIASHCGQPLETLQVHRFSDGEVCPQLTSDVQGKHVCLIQATYPPATHLMELLLTIDAANRAHARTITAIVPYLGYMRQDRPRHVGSPVGAQLQAQLLQTAGLDHIITCDLHNPAIASFFDCPIEQVSHASIFLPYLQRLPRERLVFVAPDAGSQHRAQPYAQHFDTPLILSKKSRSAPNQVDTIEILGHVVGKDAVIIDDIVDTGATICQTAQKLRAQGARTVRACCTHPVLSGQAHELLANTALDEMVVADTIPLLQHSPKIKVCSVAPLLAQALLKMI